MQGLGSAPGIAVPYQLVSHVPEGHSGYGMAKKPATCIWADRIPMLMPSQQNLSLSQLAEVSPTGAVESDGRFQVRMCP